MVRATPRPLSICLIEPGEPGQGMAYSTPDPDHRLNAPAQAHSVMAADIMHFSRWARASGLAEQDPEALWPDGGAYFRRRDFAAYLAEALAEHSHWAATGSTITHLRDRVTAARPSDPGKVLTLASGAEIAAKMVVLATGNPAPRLPTPLTGTWSEDPRIVENPFRPGCLAELDPASCVVVLGTGLTALDVIATLLAQGHEGQITALSRRGLRPRALPPSPPAMAFGLGAQDKVSPTLFLDRVLGMAPDFIPKAPKLVEWLRALRRQVARSVAEGSDWYPPFDALRDSLWQLWPRLPLDQQRRFVRQLRPWYDAHRFRAAPQTGARIEAAIKAGQVRYQAARLLDLTSEGSALSLTLRPRGHHTPTQMTADVLINATGLDTAAGIAANPLLKGLVDEGQARPDPLALGLEVDLQGRVIGQDGRPDPTLRAIGPPTLGTFGDPIGAIYIAIQIHRFLPAIFSDLGELV
jgi:uncharacterized NAD(P)/FAD-binding protein YdhS